MHPVFLYSQFPLKSLDLWSRRHDIPLHYRVEPSDFLDIDAFDQTIPSIAFQSELDTFQGGCELKHFILHYVCDFSRALLGRQSAGGAGSPASAKRYTPNPANGMSDHSINF